MVASIERTAMQAAQNIRLTLSADLAEEFESVRRTKRRTPSQLVKEALRSYLSFLRHFPELPPSRSEKKAIRQGREAYARGDYISLDELLQPMGTGHNQTRGKKPKQISRKG
jgi:hypothetical protein